LRQAKSGNPGYLDGYPMLIAHLPPSGSDEEGARQIFEGGFKLVGADKEGSCILKNLATLD